MTQNLDTSTWPARLALGIAKEVRRYRKVRGMSAQQLADRCAEIGMPIQRSVLANLESGRRAAVGVAELLVIARALHIPAIALICPFGFEEQMEFLPGVYEDPLDVANWICGQAVLEEEDVDELDALPIGRGYYFRDCLLGLEISRDYFDEARKDQDSLTRAEVVAGLRVNELQREVDLLEKQSEERPGDLALMARLDQTYEKLMAARSEGRRYRSVITAVNVAEEGYRDSYRSVMKAYREIVDAGLLAPELPDWVERYIKLVGEGSGG